MVKSLPNIYEDRMPYASLARQNSSLAEILRDRNIFEDKTNRVHFCGMAHADNDEAALFVPRRASSEGPKDLARLTMRVISKYGNQTKTRQGINREEGDNSDLVALVTELTEDFRKYGIYSERARIKNRNSGKPDWGRTISSEMAYRTQSGNVIYTDIRTTRSQDTYDNPLSRIQGAVLRSILNLHGWWLDPMPNRVNELSYFPDPQIPEALWRSSLKRLLPTLYDNRALTLTHNLLRWLERNDGKRVGTKFFGIKDFSLVWEQMLRCVLPNVEEGWNSKLPITGYLKDPSNPKPEMTSYMMTDMVVRTEKGLGIIDAKYYHAGPSGGLPSGPDIIKQIFYQQALESITDNIHIDNAFIFPTNDAAPEAWKGAGIFMRDKTVATDFPPIKVFYVEIATVMQAYITNQKINHIKW